MFGLVVRFELRAGAEADFDALVASLTPQIRKREPGTLMYAVSCELSDGAADVRIFVEIYRDRAAFAEHEGQEHVKHFLAERGRYVESLRVEFFEPYDGKGVPGLTT